MRYGYFLFLLLCLFPLALPASVPYTVTFKGVEQPELVGLLNDASQLIVLQDKPPPTMGALVRRIEGDISNLVKALHSQAHYNAIVTYTVDDSVAPAVVAFNIDPGPVYPLAAYEIKPVDLGIRLKDLGLAIGDAALPKVLLEAEEKLLFAMACKGYPLAKIKNRQVIAEQKRKAVVVTIEIDSGPLTYFGETVIEGNSAVLDKFVKRKIAWRAGEVYDPKKIECTVNALEGTGLFSSVAVSHGDLPEGGNRVPMSVHLSEAKHRSVGLGLSYSTQRGPGGTGEWVHRNFRGMGETLSLHVNALQQTQDGIVSYVIPDFRRPGQDLVWRSEVEHDDTEGYEKTSFAVSGSIERQLSNRLRVSYGLKYEHLKSKGERKDGSKRDQTFNLAKIPLQLRWVNVDDLLDPTYGSTLYLKAVPSMQLYRDPFAYCILSATASAYVPLDHCGRWVFAQKINFGSIPGADGNSIPEPELFFAGSENTLRGYKYYTVSPLSRDNDPLGGRSLFIYSAELRWRATEKLGWAAFYDAGNVYSTVLPKLDKKLLHSVGVGGRYYTPVGPIRLDVAFPLNRRKKIDKPFQVYFSVGQAF